MSSSTSMAGIARSKLDLPVWWRRGTRFGISRYVCRANGKRSTRIASGGAEVQPCPARVGFRGSDGANVCPQ